MPVPKRDRNSFNQFPNSYRWNYVRYGDCDSGADYLNSTPGAVVDGAVYNKVAGAPTISADDDIEGTHGLWVMQSGSVADIGALEFGSPGAEMNVTTSIAIADFRVLHDSDPAQLLQIVSTDSLARTFGLIWNPVSQQWFYIFANGTDPALNGAVPVGIGPSDQFNNIRLEVGTPGTRYLINNQVVFETKLQVDAAPASQKIPRYSIRHGVGADAAPNKVILDYYVIQQALTR